MNAWGPVRWRYLGIFALLLGGPTLLVTHPIPTMSALGVLGALLGGRALWRNLEPIPPELWAPDRPLGLPPPGGAPGTLRPVAESVGAAGVARAFRRSLGLPQTYARTGVAFLLLAGGTFLAGMFDLSVDSPTVALVFYAASTLFGAAVSLGTVGVLLMLRESRREARDGKLDG